MAERTQEQTACDNALDEAIRQAATAYEIVGDGEIVTQWAVVLAAAGEDEGKTIYGHMFPGGTQPSYISVGLFRVSERQLLRMMFEEDDDDAS